MHPTARGLAALLTTALRFVRLRSSVGAWDAAATGTPYPLRVDLGNHVRIELSQYDRPVAIQAPPGALKAR